MKKLSVPMGKWELILGWVYFALQLTVIPFALVLANASLNNPLSESELNFTFFCINFGCVLFIFWRFLIANGRIALRSPGKMFTGALIGFVIYWFLTIIVSNVILFINPQFFNVNDASIGSLVEENATLISFATILLVPITEELLYRGLIFRGLYNYSRFAAYLVSTLAFAAIHVVGYIGLYEPSHLLLCLLQYMPAGLSLGWAYARADSIWAPILIHITVNQIGIYSMR